MASINTYPNEITPLVRVRSVSEYKQPNRQVHPLHNHAVNRIVLLCFLVILLVGSFCGGYLLVVEGETFEVAERFDFVTQKEWGVNISQADIDKYPSNLPFSNVLLIFISEDINNKKCNDTANMKKENVNKIQNVLLNDKKYGKFINEGHEIKMNLESNTNCSKEIKYKSLDLNAASHSSKIMSKNYDIEEILYNFYVNEEGTIFEGRGFSMKPFCSKCDGVLAIGYKGMQNAKFTDLASKIKAFLDYSTSKNNLNRCFKILVDEPDNSWLLVDVSNLINKLNKKSKLEYGC